MSIRVSGNIYQDYPTLVYSCNVPLSKALKDLIEKPAVLDCTIANTICRIVCMQVLMGNDFDVYAKTVAEDLVEKDSLDRFIFILPHQLSKTLGQASEVPIGALLTYYNIPEYPKVHPKGMTQAENLYCVEEGKYLGFGSHFTEPKTLAEIADDFYEAFMLESPSIAGKEIQLKYKDNKEGFIKALNEKNRSFNVGLLDLDKIKEARSILK